jgi:hypothetical protein
VNQRLFATFLTLKWTCGEKPGEAGCRLEKVVDADELEAEALY